MRHLALLYDDLDGFVDGTVEFVTGGLDAGEPVMVAVPTPHIAPLREALNGSADSVRFADMTEVGTNPSRIIPALQQWFAQHEGERVRFVGEPIWPGRSEREAVEGMRHEALLNVAFADVPAAILCPYDVSGLDPRIVEEAEHTHPLMVCDSETRDSTAYTDPAVVYAADDRPLPSPPDDAEAYEITSDLSGVRRFVRDSAARARMGAEQLSNLLVAATEAATNTLMHGGGDGVIRAWREPGTFVCEVSDSGVIDDLLVGRLRPDPGMPDGRGMFLINQLCDLVELRPDAHGTVVRLHMRLA
jgi:anti-sigma regulatory factor (Ser/Thr protein kinase)